MKSSEIISSYSELKNNYFVENCSFFNVNEVKVDCSSTNEKGESERIV